MPRLDHGQAWSPSPWLPVMGEPWEWLCDVLSEGEKGEGKIQLKDHDEVAAPS
jgi:hypothetical protein